MKTIFAVCAFACVLSQFSINFCLMQEVTSSHPQSHSTLAPRKLNRTHLPNAIQIHSKVISGGQPDGEQAFRELTDLGVKTIISVDGAKPEVALAKKHGLRYVHLPHGYDGISPERRSELAKAVRDFDGPIYIHCHHGKHRSPAAAAVACVSAGFIEPEATLGILKLAGTNENYRGLFASVVNARRIEDAVLDDLKAVFPEVAQLSPTAEAMVELAHTHDRIQQIAASGWQTLPDHPDLDPAHEALLMKEHFTEMLRMEFVSRQPEGFQAILKDSESDAQQLEAAIRQWNLPAKSKMVPASIVEPFRRISENCVACHRHYRD